MEQSHLTRLDFASSPPLDFSLDLNSTADHPLIQHVEALLLENKKLTEAFSFVSGLEMGHKNQLQESSKKFKMIQSQLREMGERLGSTNKLLFHLTSQNERLVKSNRSLSTQNQTLLQHNQALLHLQSLQTKKQAELNSKLRLLEAEVQSLKENSPIERELAFETPLTSRRKQGQSVSVRGFMDKENKDPNEYEKLSKSDLQKIIRRREAEMLEKDLNLQKVEALYLLAQKQLCQNEGLLKTTHVQLAQLHQELGEERENVNKLMLAYEASRQQNKILWSSVELGQDRVQSR